MQQYYIQPTKDEFLLHDGNEDLAKAFHVQTLIDLLIDAEKRPFTVEVLGYRFPDASLTNQ